MSGIDERMAALRTRFLARAADDRAALVAARETGDQTEVRRIAHGLAGAAGVFGFAEISSAARRVDEAAVADIEPPLTELLRLLDETN